MPWPATRLPKAPTPPYRGGEPIVFELLGRRCTGTVVWADRGFVRLQLDLGLSLKVSWDNRHLSRRGDPPGGGRAERAIGYLSPREPEILREVHGYDRAA